MCGWERVMNRISFVDLYLIKFKVLGFEIIFGFWVIFFESLWVVSRSYLFFYLLGKNRIFVIYVEIILIF